jgi:tetratricopeptide (TPR) repeat protein
MRLSAQLHERLVGRLVDADLDQVVMGSLGIAYYRMGRYQEALTATERALATARRIKDRQAEAAHVNALGIIFNDLGQQPTAIEYYQQALAIARDLSDRQGEGVYLGNLGNVFADLGDEDQAIEHYQRALIIAQETEDRQTECFHLGNLGLCYQFHGDVVRAVAYYEQALAIARDLGYRLLEGSNLAALGESHAIVGTFERAIEYLQQALAIFREIADRPRESGALLKLAESQACMGFVADATDLSQALDIAREMGDPRSEGFSLANLAQMLCDKGQYQAAASAALEAVRIGEKIGNVRISSSAHGAVALARLLIGDLPGARSAAEAARGYRSPNNDDNVLALLGVVAVRQGDTAAAREAFTQALAKTADLLSHSAQNYDAFDNRALALCGLALCDGTDQMQEALDAYRSARAITAAPGVVRRTLRLLDALAVGDRTGPWRACARPLPVMRSQILILRATSSNLASVVQRLPDSQTREQANLQQNPES